MFGPPQRLVCCLKQSVVSCLTNCADVKVYAVPKHTVYAIILCLVSTNSQCLVYCVYIYAFFLSCFFFHYFFSSIHSFIYLFLVFVYLFFIFRSLSVDEQWIVLKLLGEFNELLLFRLKQTREKIAKKTEISLAREKQRVFRLLLSIYKIKLVHFVTFFLKNIGYNVRLNYNNSPSINQDDQYQRRARANHHKMNKCAKRAHCFGWISCMYWMRTTP